MLHGVKPWALGKHPAGENPLLLARELDLVHFDEGGGVGRFGRGARIADPWGDLQRAELDGLIDGDLKMGNAAGHLVEGGEHGNRVLDGLGVAEPARQADSCAR